MCAQFLTREVRVSPARSPSPAATAGALVVVEGAAGLPPGMYETLAESERRYRTALEALAQQRVVMESLQELIDKKIPCTRLCADAAAQTDVTGSGGDIPFAELLTRKLELWRWKERRRAAAICHQRQLEALRSELQQLRDASEDVVPRGVAVIGIAKEGRLEGL